MASILRFLKSIFNFRHQKKQLLHIVLLSFLIFFTIARGWSLIIGNGIYFRGYHIHHFYFGTLALAAGGLMALLSENTKALRWAAGLIGLGIGLFADEIGLLLNCTTSNRICAYAFPDTSDIIGAIAFAILLLLVAVDISLKRSK
ncbi:MAG: hypothetical protein HY918_05120 [Candidatus Doudnabacteria bacterium]|nr:hypothetical protein [Candidatus Doudnabacteria bacterium]